MTDLATTLRQLRAVFRETLGLFAYDPLGMLAVVVARLLDGKEASSARINAIIARRDA